MNASRRNRPTARLVTCCACFLGATLSAGNALAQSSTTAPAPLRPPTPGAPAKQSTVMYLLTAALIVAIVLAAAFIPAKRTHQD